MDIATKYLEPYEVPSKTIIMDEIPTNSSGKPDKVKLVKEINE